MIAYLLQGLTLGVAAGAQPGPFQTYIITQTLTNGWRKTLVAAFAPLISDGPIILLAAFVLRQVPEGFLRGLHVAGGLFILFLARSSFKQWRAFNPDAAEESGSEQSLLKAATMNLVSPGPYIFWSLVSGPILIEGLNEAASYGIGFLAAFYGSIVSINILLIMLVGLASQIGERIRQGLLLFASLALAIFGFYQLYLGIIVVQ